MIDRRELQRLVTIPRLGGTEELRLSVVEVEQKGSPWRAVSLATWAQDASGVFVRRNEIIMGASTVEEVSGALVKLLRSFVLRRIRA
jgi:hypothetical protein